MTSTQAHSLIVTTYGINRYYHWRCNWGQSGHGEAPAGSSKEDIAERAWRDHDESLLSLVAAENTRAEEA